jgi:post-segregation antitoxin (ccd killing protein)
MNEVRQTKTEEGPQAQLSVPSSLLTQAQELGVDAARAAADGIRRAVINVQARQYAEENREAADAWNAYVAANGLPFEDIMEQPI